jgi:hypothetical protein
MKAQLSNNLNLSSREPKAFAWTPEELAKLKAEVAERQRLIAKGMDSKTIDEQIKEKGFKPLNEKP